MLVSLNAKPFIEKCLVDSANAVHSDHQALKLILRLKALVNKSKPKKSINWNKFMYSDIQLDFNTKLSNVVNNCVDLGYEEFRRYMKDVAKDVALEEVDAIKGWFEYNRDFLMPILKERNKLLYESKMCDGEDEYLK